MFCSKCGCSLLANAKYCHVRRQATDTSSSVPVSSSTSVVTNSGTGTTTTTAGINSPVTSLDHSCRPVSFYEYRQRKEKEINSRFKPKAKKAKIETSTKGNEKTPSEVKINIGLIKLRAILI